MNHQNIPFILYLIDLPEPSKTYQYDDRTGFLGEDIVIESPVQTGKITWFVLYYKLPISELIHLIAYIFRFNYLFDLQVEKQHTFTCRQYII